MLEVQQNYTTHSWQHGTSLALSRGFQNVVVGPLGVATPGSCACNTARSAQGGKETYHGKSALAVTLCLYTEV